MKLDCELLPRTGADYKANLHCHTTHSDGKLTPSQTRDAYQAQGYSVVAFTDHRRYGWYPKLMDDTFVPLAAFEADLDTPGQDYSYVKTYHMNFYDCAPETRGEFQAPQPDFAYGDTAALIDYVAGLRAQGFLACYNHPYWSLQNYDDYKDLRGFDYMEIYNHGCEIDGLYGYQPQAYDEMLRSGQRLGCVATDDNHNWFAFGHPRCDSFGGATMLRLPRLGYAEVIHALQNRHYYATTGPELHELYIENGVLHVRCSPVEKIYVITAGRNTHSEVSDSGDTLTEAAFPLKGNEGYIRVDCQDTHRRHAYSCAYWLDEMQK